MNDAMNRREMLKTMGAGALAASPDLLTRSGDLTSSWEVAREFGFTDVDGRAVEREPRRKSVENGDDRGTNYAQARYLLYYLQQQGLLVRYWRELRAQAAVDPTGYAALQAVLGEQDLAAFQKRWQKWVLGLQFPPSS